jgi:ABC-2 type transport system ATP-binding protein
MINVDSLVKHYGKLKAVDGVSFTAKPGSVFGFLGPNGAGKSTTINCVSGLLQPDGGSVSILGHDTKTNPVEAKRNLGIVPQEIALYEDLSAQDNLAYWGSVYGLRGKTLKLAVDRVLELVGLSDRRKTAVKKMSGGMKRRLNFAAGVVHGPKVLLLDEPTVGVDPQSRGRLLDLVRRQADEGTCVLYTTHYMEEAQTLCDELAIIDQGRIVAQGTLDDLRAQTGGNDLVRFTGTFPEGHVGEALARLGDLDIMHQDAGALSLSFKNGAARLPELLQALAQAGAEVRETTLTRPSLESLFIKLTGRDLRD